MQITLNPYSAAEVRLIAAFMQDYADLVELQTLPMPPVETLGQSTEPAPAPAEEPAPKKASKPRKEKQPVVPEPEPAVEPGETEPAGSAETQTGSGQQETAPVADVTHDDVRKLFGTLAEKGLRNDAIAIVKARGFNGIATIDDDQLADIHAELEALL